VEEVSKELQVQEFTIFNTTISDKPRVETSKEMIFQFQLIKIASPIKTKLIRTSHLNFLSSRAWLTNQLRSITEEPKLREFKWSKWGDNLSIGSLISCLTVIYSKIMLFTQRGTMMTLWLKRRGTWSILWDNKVDRSSKLYSNLECPNWCSKPVVLRSGAKLDSWALADS